MVAFSSAESGYVALSHRAREVSWIRKLFWEMCRVELWDSNASFQPTDILMDSSSPQYLPPGLSISARSKQIGLNIHLVRELFSYQVTILHHAASAEHLADMLTKVVFVLVLILFVSHLGLDGPFC